MIQKNGSILINQFPGIGQSPVSGFADFRNLDIFSEPGVARLNLATVKQSSTTITGLPMWIVQDPTNGHLYTLDNGGKVYTSTDSGDTWSQVTGNTTTGAAGNGLGLFVASDGDRFLIVVRNTIIDIYDIVDTTWTNGWQTGLNSNAYHPVFIGQDNNIYIGHGNDLASIVELTAFEPGTGASFTYTAVALDLPAENAIRCLAELGDKLMLGTTKSSAVGAEIFPWNHLDSAESFEKPIKIQDDGVRAMVTANNLLYVITGRQANIHITNGTSVQFVRSLPYHNYGFWTGETLDVLPGAIMRAENQIYFGVSTVSTNGSTPYGPYGVYGLTLDGKTLTFEYQISTGTVTNATALKIGAIFPTNYPCIGWQDNSTYGMDTVDLSNNYYTSYSGYFDTPLYPVGMHVEGKSYQDIDILLVKELASGQGVRVKYRVNLTDSFTTLATFDFTTHGARSSINLAASVDNVDQIQYRVELTSPGTGTPELRQILHR